MNAIKHHIITGIFMVKLNLQGQLEYPAFLFGWLLNNTLQFAAGIGMMWVITNQFNDIGGWSFGHIAFMYGLGVMSHGLAVVLFIQTWYIDGLVIDGGFDRMLLRPMNMYYQFCMFYFNLIGLTDMIPGLVIFIFGAVVASFQFSFINIIGLLLVLAGATMIRGGVATITGSIGFWTKNTQSINEIIHNLTTRTNMYPLSIFGRATQMVLTFALPLGFVAFYPAAYFLDMDMGFNFPGFMPLWTFLVGLGCMLIGRAIFNAGLRHYDSSGN